MLHPPQAKAKCHSSCVVFEARSSALAPFLALKRYYKPNLIKPALVSPVGEVLIGALRCANAPYDYG
jgi:hypothetical protein